MSEPLDILAITANYPPAAHGGYGEIAADMSEGLARRGHRVRMLTSRSPELPEREERGGVEVERALEFVLAGWRRPAAIAATRVNQAVVRLALSERRPDVVLVWHMRGLPKTPLRLLHEAGLPVVYYVHDLWLAYDRPGALFLPWPKLDARLKVPAIRDRLASLLPGKLDLRTGPVVDDALVLFNSNWMRDDYERRGLHLPRTRVVPIGVDANAIASLRAAPAAAPAKRLLYAARVDHRKGIKLAIHALATLPSEISMTVTGQRESEGYEQAMRELAVEQGVAGRIEWLPEQPRDQLLRILASHDVLVYPSIEPESFGLLALEAMAAGTPVVTSASGGAREFLAHEKNALVFGPGDLDGLVHELARLVADPDLVGGLVAGGRVTASRWTLDGATEQLEDALAGEAR